MFRLSLGLLAVLVFVLVYLGFPQRSAFPAPESSSVASRLSGCQGTLPANFTCSIRNAYWSSECPFCVFVVEGTEDIESFRSVRFRDDCHEEIGPMDSLQIRTFKSLDELSSFVEKNVTQRISEPVIPILGHYYNFAHAIMDTMWPALVTSLFHGVADTFRILLTNIDASYFSDAKPPNVREANFAGRVSLQRPLYKTDVETAGTWTRLDHLIVGAGSFCGVDHNYALKGASAGLGAFRLFRERVLASYGLSPGRSSAASRSQIVASRHRKLRVVYFWNKRFPEGSQEHTEMMDALHSLNGSVVHYAKGGGMTVETVYRKPSDYKGDMGRECADMLQTDVLIVGPGTGCFGSLWLPDGATVVWFGAARRNVRDFTLCKWPLMLEDPIPTYHETYLANSNPFIRGVFEPWADVLRPKEAAKFRSLISEGIRVAVEGFSIPVAVGTDLPADARVFTDIMSDHNFAGTTIWDQIPSCINSLVCHPDILLNGIPPADLYNKEFTTECGQKKVCRLNLTLFADSMDRWQAGDQSFRAEIRALANTGTPSTK
uniref:Exostosin GT47 domain-containing protein n=1 Tax=Chromera velia CCMP2878 TaxID=1169474 RepID=A0A0G4G5A1_9ALVE|eukprot:Cvel_4207.t1-p1 / transcript=Cvel_4207.t1 / gene=Cvel_4207 / organism=Chromera_velia_CCMP2878 / gene_product=hypothetical protein / transcript_product=hypothetical protein / location=Cvel_scaffold181:108122-109756(+) / protein_length=545 / sequence_SO=supercontig / SO=protein_coding / is_pseudo=false